MRANGGWQLKERELESPLVWQPRLSLALRHAGSQRATASADCGLAKVTVARAAIELDHTYWSVEDKGSQELREEKHMCSQHNQVCLSVGY